MFVSTCVFILSQNECLRVKLRHTDHLQYNRVLIVEFVHFKMQNYQGYDKTHFNHTYIIPPPKKTFIFEDLVLLQKWHK